MHVPLLHDLPPALRSRLVIGGDAGAFVVTASAPIHQRTWALYSASHLRRGQFLPIYKLCSRKKKKKKEKKKTRISFAPSLHFLPQVLITLIAVSLFILDFRLISPFVSRKEGKAACLKFCFGRKLAVFVHSFDRLGSFVGTKSMGAQISKTAGKDEAAVEKPAEGAAVASKANGQENGHAKTNGDASPAAEDANKADVQANGSTPTEEVPKEEGEKVEDAEAPGDKEASTTNGETSAKPEEGAPSTSEDGKQKKKRFSFKKPSFKLSGFSFKKTKKESEEATKEGASAGAEPAEGEKSTEAPAEETEPAEASGGEVKETATEEVKAEEPKAEQAAEGEEKPAKVSPTEPEAAASPEAAAAAE
uniref:Myristoylated alanine-rich C-kinase substrate n=2 Tax=Poecilia latipinna TaxID=48699 RepID=A0A3B3U7M2_9TELE